MLRMSVRPLFLIAPLVCAPLLCRAQEPAVTLGPAVLTFPEIARKLSIGDRRVVCPLALRNRAAFIRLKDRSWKETQELLSRTLDVRFLPDSAHPHEYTLSVDPSVAARDAAWQRRAAELFLEDAQKGLADIRPFLNRTYGDLVRRHVALSAALKEAEKQDPDRKRSETEKLAEERDRLETYLSPDEWVGASAIMRATVDDVLRCMRGTQPFRLIDLRREIDPAALRAMVAMAMEEYKRETEKERTEEELGLQPPDPAEIEAFLSGNVPMRHRLIYDPGARTLAVDCLMEAGGHVSRTSVSGGTTQAEEAPTEVPDLFARLGPDAKAWSESLKKVTQQLLQSAAGSASFPVNDKGRTESLSQVIEAWSNATGGEAVIELMPMDEDVLLPDIERTDTETGVVTPPVRQASLAGVWKSCLVRDAWFATMDQGVLVVKDGCAFLQHMRSWPLEAFLRLERHTPIRRIVDRWLPSPDLAAVIDYYRAVPAEQNIDMGRVGSYRGVWMDDFGAFGPYAVLLSRLPAGEREVIENECGREGGYTLPLVHVAAGAVEELARGLQTLAMVAGGDSHASEEFYLPTFPAILKQGQVLIQRKGRRNQGSAELKLPNTSEERSYTAPYSLGAMRFR